MGMTRLFQPRSIPIASMYGIFIWIYHKKSTIHVGKCTIHGMLWDWVLWPRIFRWFLLREFSCAQDLKVEATNQLQPLGAVGQEARLTRGSPTLKLGGYVSRYKEVMVNEYLEYPMLKEYIYFCKVLVCVVFCTFFCFVLLEVKRSITIIICRPLRYLQKVTFSWLWESEIESTKNHKG